MNTRRPAHAVGDSWRKWQDPLMYGPLSRPAGRLAVFAFWLACIDVGAVFAMWVLT